MSLNKVERGHSNGKGSNSNSKARVKAHQDKKVILLHHYPSPCEYKNWLIVANPEFWNTRKITQLWISMWVHWKHQISGNQV